MVRHSQNKKGVDSDRDCELIYRSANMASNTAIENLALKLLELKKRLEAAHNEQ